HGRSAHGAPAGPRRALDAAPPAQPEVGDPPGADGHHDVPRRDVTRLKVMFCIPELDRGGPDAVFFNLLRTLDRHRFEPFLVVTKPTGAYLDELPDDIPVLRTDERRYPVRSVIDHVRSVRPDVVLATLRMSFTCTAARPFFPRRARFVCRVAN